MQSPDTDDAPLVPYTPDRSTDETVRTDGSGCELSPPFDRPPKTDHATPYTRDDEEIEPFVADLR
ncbi:hypothetical protein KY092_15700 [Natronomonas gomsonensis]|uniref:hypothetical protein n=1 Tax=Natronomonas gomsonensis TaxID=1046043 RepID=UPI0020CA91F8|nr:hypothetical protein [Natronomonas gomsonensis]MCY4732006.1 hypothetical protein [Natronomonas gomsonensis]